MHEHTVNYRTITQWIKCSYHLRSVQDTKILPRLNVMLLAFLSLFLFPQGKTAFKKKTILRLRRYKKYLNKELNVVS